MTMGHRAGPELQVQLPFCGRFGRVSAAVLIPWHGEWTAHPIIRGFLQTGPRSIMLPLRARPLHSERSAAFVAGTPEHTMDFETLHYEVRDAVASLILTRPARANALNARMLEEINIAMDR